MFICNHCPFVVLLKQAIIDLAKDYASQGVGIVAISSNSAASHPQDGPELMAKDAKELGYPFPYLYDESQDIAKVRPPFSGPEQLSDIGIRARLLRSLCAQWCSCEASRCWLDKSSTLVSCRTFAQQCLTTAACRHGNRTTCHIHAFKVAPEDVSVETACRHTRRSALQSFTSSRKVDCSTTANLTTPGLGGASQ